MNCSVCGGTLKMKDDGSGASCLSCGLEYSLDFLKAANSEKDISVTSSTHKEEAMNDHELTSDQRMIETETSKVIDLISTSNLNESEVNDEPCKNPLGFDWKTNIPASILGLICGAGINALPLEGDFGFVVTLVFGALAILYAIGIYPRYFHEKPLIKSSGLISFFNFLFGGLIFGALFNANLTKQRKGVSYIVAAVISCFGMLFFLYTWLAFSSPLENVKNYSYAENGYVELPVAYSYDELESEVVYALECMGKTENHAKEIFRETYCSSWASLEDSYDPSYEQVGYQKGNNSADIVLAVRRVDGPTGSSTYVDPHLKQHSGSHLNYCEHAFIVDPQNAFQSTWTYVLTIYTGCKHENNNTDYSTAYYVATIEQLTY